MMDPMHLVSLFGAFQASLQGRGRGMPVRRLYGLPPFRPAGGSMPGSWDTKLDGRTPLDEMGEVVDAHRPRMQAQAKRERRRGTRGLVAAPERGLAWDQYHALRRSVSR